MLVLVGIVIAGAAFGFWTVRKFVISEDGGVDASVAQFVKWAMRSVAATFIFQVKCMVYCVCSGNLSVIIIIIV